MIHYLRSILSGVKDNIKDKAAFKWLAIILFAANEIRGVLVVAAAWKYVWPTISAAYGRALGMH